MIQFSYLFFFTFLLSLLKAYKDLLTLSGLGGGGGGGLRGPDDQTDSCLSETSYSLMLKLSDF